MNIVLGRLKSILCFTFEFFENQWERAKKQHKGKCKRKQKFVSFFPEIQAKGTRERR